MNSGEAGPRQEQIVQLMLAKESGEAIPGRCTGTWICGFGSMRFDSILATMAAGNNPDIHELAGGHSTRRDSEQARHCDAPTRPKPCRRLGDITGSARVLMALADTDKRRGQAWGG